MKDISKSGQKLSDYQAIHDTTGTVADTTRDQISIVIKVISSASIECEDEKLLEEKLNDISEMTSVLNCAGVTYSLSIDPFYWSERPKGNILTQHWTSTWIVPKR